MARDILHKLRQKFRHRLVLQVLLDDLAGIGLEFTPFYIFREGQYQEPPPNREQDCGDCEWGFLGPDDMPEIVEIPDRYFALEELTDRFAQGMLCYGVRCGGRIAAFTWANLGQCHSRYFSFPLKSNEAYLFDAYTMQQYRGRNIAPVLRYRFCEILKGMGRDTYYSYSAATNTPALRFKRKLGARPAQLCLYIELFRRWRRLWVLRNYRQSDR